MGDMDKKIQVIRTPEYLNENWDKLVTCYFQKKEFLSVHQKYNICQLRYYELYVNGNFSC